MSEAPAERYFSAAALLAEAQSVAGSDDWGDTTFREPYERLVAAINAEAELSAQGVARSRSYILRRLVGLLKLQRDRKVYPGIVAEEIRRPLFVTGQGRSGTSYTNALLASDPRCYAPLHWQIWSLSPPPNLPGADHGPQIAEGERLIAFEGWQDRVMRDKHDFSATNAAEDTLIQDYAFLATSASFWHVPSFNAYLATADYSAAYKVMRKILQALQFGLKRDLWVLKSPLHFRQLSYLFAEFPDARLAVTHRDPVKSLASSASMIVAFKKQFGNTVPPPTRRDALAMMESTAAGLETMIKMRSDPKMASVWADIQYLDLESDPLGQVAKIYDRFDIEFTDAARQSMHQYKEENRKGKFGVHRYDITEAGLTAGEVRERFKFYTDYFDIPYEVKV